MRLTMNALLPAMVLLWIAMPKADQQVGTKTDALPTDEEQQ